MLALKALKLVGTFSTLLMEDLAVFFASSASDTKASFVTFAASLGCLDVVRQCHERGVTGFTKETFDKAAEGGHIQTVKFLRTSCSNKKTGCTFTKAAMDSASANGHLEVVKFLHGIKVPASQNAMNGRRQEWALRYCCVYWR
jgi:hypothetical protein